MNEDALRALVRDTLARIATREQAAPASEAPVVTMLPAPGHASHFRYSLPPSGGPCLIEPGVQCNHCGYCQSHGH